METANNILEAMTGVTSKDIAIIDMIKALRCEQFLYNKEQPILEKDETFEFEYDGRKITALVVNVAEEIKHVGKVLEKLRRDDIEFRPCDCVKLNKEQREIKLPIDTPLLAWEEGLTKDDEFHRFSEYENGILRCFHWDGDFFTSGGSSGGAIYEHAETVEELLPDGTPKFTYWSGGECPVSWWVGVEVVRRDGGREVEKALDIYWGHDGDGNRNDIIAYRILGGQKIL